MNNYIKHKWLKHTKRQRMSDREKTNKKFASNIIGRLKQKNGKRTHGST